MKGVKSFDKTTDQVPKDEEPLILTNEIEDEKTLDIKQKKILQPFKKLLLKII